MERQKTHAPNKVAGPTGGHRAAVLFLHAFVARNIHGTTFTVRDHLNGQEDDRMLEYLMKAALTAKTILGLGVAYEAATAGQIVTAVSMGAIGIAPHLWPLTRRLVERGEQTSI